MDSAFRPDRYHHLEKKLFFEIRKKRVEKHVNELNFWLYITKYSQIKTIKHKIRQKKIDRKMSHM